MSDIPSKAPLTQVLEEHAMSPQCFGGQHEDCKTQIHFIAEDGVARTIICACRCHEKAPTSDREPIRVWLISWEYEHVQPPQLEGETEMRAWIKRRVITNSKSTAEDWLDAIATQIQTNKVRNLSVLRGNVDKWEPIQ